MEAKSAEEMFADAMLECAHSEEGCRRLPVRMIAEMNGDPNDPADVDMVLLCKVHAPLYVSTGRVLFDKPIVTDEEILAAL